MDINLAMCVHDVGNVTPFGPMTPESRLAQQLIVFDAIDAYTVYV